MSRYAPRLILRRRTLPPTAAVYPLHTATLAVYDIDPVTGQPGQPAIGSQDDVHETRVPAIGSQDDVHETRVGTRATCFDTPGQDDADTVHREHYLSANACIPARPIAPLSPSFFSELSLKDERTRRRVTRLLAEVDGAAREFSQAEVVDLAGRAEGLCSILRRVFSELPYSPARRLGEVKMYRVQDEAVRELKALVEVRHGTV